MRGKGCVRIHYGPRVFFAQVATRYTFKRHTLCKTSGKGPCGPGPQVPLCLMEFSQRTSAAAGGLHALWHTIVHANITSREVVSLWIAREGYFTCATWRAPHEQIESGTHHPTAFCVAGTLFSKPHFHPYRVKHGSPLEVLALRAGGILGMNMM